MLLPLLLLLATSFTSTHASEALGLDLVDGNICHKYVRGRTKYLGSHNVEAVCLTPKQNLDVGSCITVGKYFLGLTPDGYLTQGLTQPGHPITWKSRNPNPRLEFTGTTLKVKYTDPILWHNNRKKATALCLKSDGDVQVLHGSETLWSKPKPKCNERIGRAVQLNGGGNARCVKQGDVLFACQAVKSDEFTLKFTGHGISLLRGKDEEWNLPTTVKSTSAYLVFQMDGYIGVYDKTGKQVWKAFTAASHGSSLCLRSNGDVVYYDGTSSVDVFPIMPSGSSTIGFVLFDNNNNNNNHNYDYNNYKNCYFSYRIEHFNNRSQKIKDPLQKQEIDISQPYKVIAFFKYRNCITISNKYDKYNKCTSHFNNGFFFDGFFDNNNNFYDYKFYDYNHCDYYYRYNYGIEHLNNHNQNIKVPLQKQEISQPHEVIAFFEYRN
ncbi:hypothetical protein HDU81_005306 [Chytriomyces hyalinus]|nr:hypothetical protein HDU81_005306 [Chytriomyces hyalinus]